MYFYLFSLDEFSISCKILFFKHLYTLVFNDAWEKWWQRLKFGIKSWIWRRKVFARTLWYNYNIVVILLKGTHLGLRCMLGGSFHQDIPGRGRALLVITASVHATECSLHLDAEKAYPASVREPRLKGFANEPIIIFLPPSPNYRRKKSGIEIFQYIYSTWKTNISRPSIQYPW